MLYLEDYLEMIEQVPQELRDRFTEMRELDLSVQNDTDAIDKQIKVFFAQCRRGEVTGTAADAQFESIKKDYVKVLEDSEEKVQLANQIYELVERYLRRLDTELLKFKCELEADNQGITELLEKRSLELDGSSSVVNQKENRYFGSISQNQNRTASSATAAERYRHKAEKRRDSGTSQQLGMPPEKRQALSSGLSTPTLRPTTPNLSHVLSTSNNSAPGFTGSAIVQAAVQAIEKTQQMQQGRRTASLKASYELIHGSGGMNTHELLMAGRDLTGTSSSSSSSHHHGLASSDRDLSFNSTPSGSSNQKRYKKKIAQQTGNMSSPQTTNLLNQLNTHNSNDSDEMVPTSYINKDGMVVEQTAEGEWTYDPNEPRYCICNQVSYGEMVACDNAECPLEWFHYPCVGITTSPKGKWYCPMCSKNRKKNKNVS